MKTKQIMTIKKEVLIKTAKELDKLLYDPTHIDFKLPPDKLTIEVEEASKELQPDDDLTKETITALTEI